MPMNMILTYVLCDAVPLKPEYGKSFVNIGRLFKIAEKRIRRITMYCEKCSRVFDEGGECPYCGSKKVRTARSDDIVLLCEVEAFKGEMLSKAFEMKELPYLLKKKLGSGFTLRAGSFLEEYSFYVPMELYEHMKEIAEVIVGFEEDVEEEEGQLSEGSGDD